MKPTLFVLAAGMGSRYGSLKQLDPLGPNGETIMDYSVYDAVRAGFGKVVFVIRESFAEDFKREVLSRFQGTVPCDICYQAIDKIPEGYSINPERSKPWGTNHAVLMAKDIIHEPFAVINADDFYGHESFHVLHDFLVSVENERNKYCMIGYHVTNTLSESGSVNRGICQTDAEGNLTGVVERIDIEEKGGRIVCPDGQGGELIIDPNALVSMNMWGFTTDYFEYAEKDFREFLAEKGMELKSEHYIPTVVNNLITKGIATCKVLDTPSKWFGVTYADDRAQVVMKISELIRKGVYPQRLF